MFKDKIKNAVGTFFKEYQKSQEELKNLRLLDPYSDIGIQSPIEAMTDFFNTVLAKELEERLNKRYLLVEDGSVDIDNLEEELKEDNIKVVVYRQGSNKPEFLNKGDKE